MSRAPESYQDATAWTAARGCTEDVRKFICSALVSGTSAMSADAVHETIRGGLMCAHAANERMRDADDGSSISELRKHHNIFSMNETF